MSDSEGNSVGLDPADPAGADDRTTAKLYIPAGRDVLLLLHSRDVIHDFFVRELRTKQDIVPGMEIPFELRVEKSGTYEIACAELCGLGHSQMRSELVVLSPEDYRRWKQIPLTRPNFLRRIFSTDHRTVARQYFFLSLLSVFLGTCLSLLMRFHLTHPQSAVDVFGKLWPVGAPGGVITPELYLSLLTLHGTLMVFFVLTLAPLNAFGNLVLPAQLGAKEMAYPWLKRRLFWITAVSFLLLISSFLAAGGGPLSGWTAYPPLSAVGAIAGPGQGAGPNSLVLFYRYLLRRFHTHRDQLHLYSDRHARPGHDLHADAADLLELVCYRNSKLAGLLGSAARRNADPAGSPRRNQLFSFPAVCWSPTCRSSMTAGHPYCGSISSGSSVTRRFTLRFCRVWAS